MLTSARPLSLVVLILLTACAPSSATSVGRAPAAGPIRHVAIDGGIAGVDAMSGAVRFTVPHGLAAPGGKTVVATTQIPEGTPLKVLNGETGDRVASQVLPGSLVAGTASPRGRLVALTETADAGGEWLAPGRERTQIVVADVQRGSHRGYALAGNYAPEVFSFRDDRLFVIEYLPALAPDRYRVRQLDLPTGQVLPVGGPTQKALPPDAQPVTVEEEMRGRSRTQVMAPDLSRLYTVYVHDEDHLHHRDYQGVGRSRPSSGRHSRVRPRAEFDRGLGLLHRPPRAVRHGARRCPHAGALTGRQAARRRGRRLGGKHRGREYREPPNRRDMAQERPECPPTRRQDHARDGRRWHLVSRKRSRAHRTRRWGARRLSPGRS